MAFLEVKKLTYGHIKGPVIINDFSCSEDNGTIFLFGEKGSGKTTLLEVLCGINDLFYGQIKIDNKEISQSTQTISYLPTQPVLLKNKTVEQNLKFASDICGKDYKKILEHDEWLQQNLNKKISKLSYYQKQILCLKRAELKDSKLILIDLDLSKNAEIDEILYINELKKYIFAKNKLVIIACDPYSYKKLQNNSKNCSYWYQITSKISKYNNIDDYKRNIAYFGMLNYIDRTCVDAKIEESINGYLLVCGTNIFKLNDKWVKNICEYFSVSKVVDVLVSSKCNLKELTDEKLNEELQLGNIMIFDAITTQRL